MSREKQIDEMAKDLCQNDFCSTECHAHCRLPANSHCWDVEIIAEKLYTAGYRKQIKGEWEWFEEWNPSTPEHPRECDDCGWRCGECKTALADIVGGYWDDPDEKPNLKFCPDCGAKMKGGAE